MAYNSQCTSDVEAADREPCQLVVDHSLWQYTPAQPDRNHHLDGFQIVGSERHRERDAALFEKPVDQASGKGDFARQNRRVGGKLFGFDPDPRLDRIELSQITDWERPMGRFMKRRGGETLYMCYIEAEEIAPIVQRLDKKGMRYAGRDPQSPNPEGIFLHPSTLHGVLMGCSRTDLAWTWSGHPELAGATAAPEH